MLILHTQSICRLTNLTVMNADRRILLWGKCYERQDRHKIVRTRRKQHLSVLIRLALVLAFMLITVQRKDCMLIAGIML